MISAFKRSMLRLIRWTAWLLMLVPVVTTYAQSNSIDRIATGGDFYAAASFDQTIYIWNSAKQQLLFTITPSETEFTYRVSDLVFNPDGTLLAASFGGGDLLPGLVRVYDVSTGKIVLELDAWTSAGDLAWKPDGTQLAVRAASGLGTHLSTHLMVWNIPSGSLVVDQDQDKNISIANIAWSADGRQVATVDDITLYLWDTATWTSKPSTLLPGGEITDFAWNVNGHYLAAVDSLGAAYVIDSLTQQIVMTLAGTSSNEYVRKVAWSSDNRLAVTNTDQILVWDTTTGNLLKTILASGVTDVTWLSDHRLLYGSSDETSPLIATLAK